MLGHRGVTGLWGTGGLLWVAVTAAAYLAAGLAAFRVLERVTKARGALGAYWHRRYSHDATRVDQRRPGADGRGHRRLRLGPAVKSS